MVINKLDKSEKLDSVIFDLDGTLWDSTREVFISWNQVLDKYDEVTKKLTKNDIENFMGTPTAKIFEDFLHYLDHDKIDEIGNECSKNEIKYIKEHGGILYPGLENVLKKLSTRFKLSIVSNCQEGYIEAFLNYYGFEKYFMDFESIGRTGLSKAENIKLVINRNNLKKSIYVGDVDGDSNAARLAGISFIYARYGFGKVEKYDYVVDNIVELLKVI